MDNICTYVVTEGDQAIIPSSRLIITYKTLNLPVYLEIIIGICTYELEKLEARRILVQNQCTIYVATSIRTLSIVNAFIRIMHSATVKDLN